MKEGEGEEEGAEIESEDEESREEEEGEGGEGALRWVCLAKRTASLKSASDASVIRSPSSSSYCGRKERKDGNEEKEKSKS